MFLNKSCFLVSLTLSNKLLDWHWYEPTFEYIKHLIKHFLSFINWCCVLKLLTNERMDEWNIRHQNDYKFSTLWWRFTAKNLYFTTWLRNYPNLHKTNFNKTYKRMLHLCTTWTHLNPLQIVKLTFHCREIIRFQWKTDWEALILETWS
jgi:hypothetical protein